jgi:ubiquinone/menaquinone biosynthesis C-methylase UbiE
MTNERVIAMFRRFFALVYDRINQPAETAGLSQERQKLLAQASGETIEIGAGTGLNLAHYPAAVTRLVLTEPDRHMAARLRRRVTAIRPDAEVLDATAAQLPFPDASFDTAVVTFVLCSVPDPDAALTEIARVLRPGGRLLFAEHVRSEDPAVAARQDRRPLTYKLIGCHPNRATLDTIASSPLRVEDVRHGEVPKVPKIERPMIVGTARLAPAG